MRSIGKIILALFIAAAFMAPAMASKVGTFGVPNSSGTAPLEVDSDRTLTVATDSGLKLAYEAATTSDTLTVADCGKTFIVNPATTSTFTLMDADVGCSVKFVASAGHANGSKKIVINPQDTDTLRGVTNVTTTSTFAAGDSTTSPGATGDSITVFCGQDTYWDVVDRTGAWTDTN